MYHLVGALHGKLEKWESEFEQGDANKEVFPTLTGCPGNPDVTKYATISRDLKKEFEARFLDFKQIKHGICLLSAILLYEVNIYIPAQLQLEVITLRNDLVYALMFTPGSDLVAAYQLLPTLTYSRIRAFATRFSSMFGSTYHCENYSPSLAM